MPHNLCSLGDPQQGEKIPSGYTTPAFSGARRGGNCYMTLPFSGGTNTKRGEKIRRCYLTPAFSWARKRVESLHNSSILGGPQSQAWEENQKWMPHPCLLGGPNDGGNAT